mgnify:CR=1 FL=1
MNIKRTIHRFFAGILILAFVISDVSAYAQGVMPLPAPGTLLTLSSAFAPPLLKGIKVYRDDPFRFDFILDKGDLEVADEQVKNDSGRLIKYFLAALTVPDNDLWVNLSPYEKDRIVPEAFGRTEMGRDLLAQDYILKQITASVIYPAGEVGKEFWNKVYAEAQSRYGTTDVPVDTFNKVWVIPDKATVYENKDAAFVVESKLKVMLEEDYLALEKNTAGKEQTPGIPATNKLGSEIIREVVIPVLEREVNEGKNFAALRQVYNSLILATWYKRQVKDSIMAQAYVDQKKTGGIDIVDKDEKEKIWAQYVEAFKRGVFDLIKEELDATTQESVPRKYFSGGFDFAMGKVFKESSDPAGLPDDDPRFKKVELNVRPDDLEDVTAIYAEMLRWDREQFVGVRSGGVFRKSMEPLLDMPAIEGDFESFQQFLQRPSMSEFYAVGQPLAKSSFKMLRSYRQLRDELRDPKVRELLEEIIVNLTDNLTEPEWIKIMMMALLVDTGYMNIAVMHMIKELLPIKGFRRSMSSASLNDRKQVLAFLAEFVFPVYFLRSEPGKYRDKFRVKEYYSFNTGIFIKSIQRGQSDLKVTADGLAMLSIADQDVPAVVEVQLGLGLTENRQLPPGRKMQEVKKWLERQMREHLEPISRKGLVFNNGTLEVSRAASLQFFAPKGSSPKAQIERSEFFKKMYDLFAESEIRESDSSPLLKHALFIITEEVENLLDPSFVADLVKRMNDAYGIQVVLASLPISDVDKFMAADAALDPLIGKIRDRIADSLARSDSETRLLCKMLAEKYSLPEDLVAIVLNNEGSLVVAELLLTRVRSFMMVGDEYFNKEIKNYSDRSRWLTWLFYEASSSLGHSGGQLILDGFRSSDEYLKLLSRLKQSQKEFEERWQNGVEGVVQTTNSADVTPKDGADTSLTGGIDLDPSRIHMATKSSGAEINFSFDSAMFQRLQNASGVTPVIIDIRPLGSLQQFMGVRQ